MVKRLLPGERVSYGGRFLVDRASTIATVPVGYDDGFPRSAEGRAEVLVRGRRCPVIGAVTMDQILVDCGDDEVVAGDEVVIAGAQGAERISLDDLASACGTIGRELATGIGARVPREYLG
jgi:alanine racemase